MLFLNIQVFMTEF